MTQGPGFFREYVLDANARSLIHSCGDTFHFFQLGFVTRSGFGQPPDGGFFSNDFLIASFQFPLMTNVSGLGPRGSAFLAFFLGIVIHSFERCARPKIRLRSLDG
jgi:hypothetical protein